MIAILAGLAWGAIYFATILIIELFKIKTLWWQRIICFVFAALFITASVFAIQTVNQHHFDNGYKAGLQWAIDQAKLIKESK